ncbi:MAG TPA: hypothetical protein VJC16_05810 [Candidatus Nanoarchaeia archaeon]|nr:hypothetical protein [Candidatus Nanoarchaeia archaeon]
MEPFTSVTGERSSADIPAFLQQLKQPKYFAAFREKNIALTRQQIREAVHADELIKQAVSCITELNRVINILMKRFREWIELHHPEISHDVRDHEKLLELAFSGKKPKDSMGASLAAADLQAMQELAAEIGRLFALRRAQEEYLTSAMERSCRNIAALAGASLGAQLILRAGSLKRLASLPASTIQLLGAEKALFRHLRSGAKSPKHGIIHEHPLVGQAPAAQRGRMARILADKIAIAARVDYFKGAFIGDQLRKDVEGKR